MLTFRRGVVQSWSREHAYQPRWVHGQCLCTVEDGVVHARTRRANRRADGAVCADAVEKRHVLSPMFEASIAAMSGNAQSAYVIRVAPGGGGTRPQPARRRAPKSSRLGLRKPCRCTNCRRDVLLIKRADPQRLPPIYPALRGAASNVASRRCGYYSSAAPILRRQSGKTGEAFCLQPHAGDRVRHQLVGKREEAQ